jgi:hypothetical protein
MKSGVNFLKNLTKRHPGKRVKGKSQVKETCSTYLRTEESNPYQDITEIIRPVR